MPEKADDAAGLTPSKEDNAFWRNSGRKDLKFLIGFKHQYRFWAPTLEKARPVRIAAQKKPEPVKADSGF